jgi:hypothetical protein
MRYYFFRLFAAIVFITATATVTAQTKIYVGPEASVIASGLVAQYGYGDDIYAGVNAQVGGTAHLQFGRFFAVRPSLLLKFGTVTSVDFYSKKFSFTRIVAPIPVMFSYQFRNDGILFVGAGPNLQLALSAKNIYNDSGTEKIRLGNRDSALKRMDAGVHVKLGYQFPMGLAINTFMNVGATNLSNDSRVKLTSLDAIGLSLGYMFGGKRKK